MSIFDQLREEVIRTQESWELDKVVAEGTEGVVRLIMKLIDWIERDTQKILIEHQRRMDKERLENDENYIDSIIFTCDTTYDTGIIYINNVWLIAMKWEEQLNQEQKNKLYEETIDMYAGGIATSLDSLLWNLSKNSSYYDEICNYINEKKRELSEVVLQRKIDLWLEFPNVEVVNNEGNGTHVKLIGEVE